MPRIQFRLSTLALLVVIVALSIAVLLQWRREAALAERLELLRTETDLELMDSRRLDIARQQRIDQLQDMLIKERASRKQ